MPNDNDLIRLGDAIAALEDALALQHKSGGVAAFDWRDVLRFLPAAPMVMKNSDAEAALTLIGNARLTLDTGFSEMSENMVYECDVVLSILDDLDSGLHHLRAALTPPQPAPTLADEQMVQDAYDALADRRMDQSAPTLGDALELPEIKALVAAGNVMANALKGSYIVAGSARNWDNALAALKGGAE